MLDRYWKVPGHRKFCKLKMCDGVGGEEMDEEVVLKETKLQERRQIDRQRRTDRRGQKRRTDIVHPKPNSSSSKEF